MRRLIATLLMMCHLPLSLVWAQGSEFNGTTSRIVVTHSAALTAAQWSFGCWTRREGNGENALGRIGDKSSSASNGFRLYNNSSTGAYIVNIGFSDLGTWTFVRPAADIWAHILMTMNATSSANDPVVYVNGSSVPLTETNAPAGSWVAGTANLVLGDSPAADRSWHGQLAHCAYWDRLLGAADVAAVACVAVGCGPWAEPSGLIAYWPMGSFEGRNYTATSGLTGTATAVSTSTVAGPLLPWLGQWGW